MFKSKIYDKNNNFICDYLLPVETLTFTNNVGSFIIEVDNDMFYYFFAFDETFKMKVWSKRFTIMLDCAIYEISPSKSVKVDFKIQEVVNVEKGRNVFFGDGNE